jgi:hypothetical protein
MTMYKSFSGFTTYIGMTQAGCWWVLDVRKDDFAASLR